MGAQTSKSQRGCLWTFLTIIGLTVVALQLASKSDNGAGDPPGTTAADSVSLPMISNAARALTRYGVGCSNLADLTRLATLETQKDEQALDQLFGELTDSGRCRLLDLGTVVFVTDTSILHQRMKVRPRGELTDYWMAPQPLSDPPALPQ